MITKNVNHFDILAAKKAFKEGRNVTEFLRAQKSINFNTSEIIEMAYDLQAGTYIENILKNPSQSEAYTTELTEILNNHLNEQDSLLDIGTGELTTLSQIIFKLKIKPNQIFAFDISWSRLYKGNNYAKKILGEQYGKLKSFVGDIKEIPLLNKSINITTSSHALEPNGSSLKEILSELFRVTIDKLILFEPYYEMNTEEGKERMDKLGYIKNIQGVVEELGGNLIEMKIIKNIANPLNPTACFIIKPPSLLEEKINKSKLISDYFSVPGTNIPLREIEGFYYSNQVGLCYPVLKSIPILKANVAILATSMLE